MNINCVNYESLSDSFGLIVCEQMVLKRKLLLPSGIFHIIKHKCINHTRICTAIVVEISQV